MNLLYILLGLLPARYICRYVDTRNLVCEILGMLLLHSLEELFLCMYDTFSKH